MGLRGVTRAEQIWSQDGVVNNYSIVLADQDTAENMQRTSEQKISAV